jgi:phospholipid/cholesterol/gamma-HCH transport system substrate-binding protein
LNELKVGFLTLMAIASLLVVSLKITSNKSGFGEYVPYKTILDDASGIYENSSIKVAGIVAGRIKTVELNGSQALITFEVLEQIKVTSFSQLRIKTVGFLGDKYIDIFLGSSTGVRLKPNSMVAAKAGAGFEELGKDASDIMKDVKEISKAIKESLYDQDQKNIAKEMMENIRVFTQNAKEISESLKTIVNGNEAKLNSIIANLKKVSSQVAFETDRYADGSFMNDLEGVKPILANVDKAVQDLKDIVSDVKDGRGTVGKLLRDDQVIDQVNETLSGVNRLVNRVNNYKTNLTLFTGVNSDNATRTDFNLDLIPSPEKFFRFGVVSSDYGRVNATERTTTTSTDGSPGVVVNESEVVPTEFKFNAQIGRKFNDFSFRVGLFETTGGLAVDYSNVSNSFITSLEAFDFDRDLGAFVRLSSEFRIWNVLYARIAGEDLASKTDGQSYTVSAGLKFNDEDLAALLGLVVN